MLKKSLGLVSGATLMFAFAYGCSSSTNSTTDTPDSGTSTNKDGGSTNKDGSTPPTGDSGSGGDCKPGDVSSFSPTWKAPSPFNQKICSNTQVEAILSCIFDDNADKATCDKVNNDKANEPCANCLLTPDTAKALGPVVITGQIGSLNTAGCIANSEGNTTDKSCGAKYQAARECADAACADNCPGSDAAALKALQGCETTALSGDCSKYATAANCSKDLLGQGGAAEKCDAGNTFLDAAINMGKLFCAGGTGGEGGADAPTEGG